MKKIAERIFERSIYSKANIEAIYRLEKMLMREQGMIYKPISIKYNQRFIEQKYNAASSLFKDLKRLSKKQEINFFQVFENFWKFNLPFLMDMANCKSKSGKPLIIGINGMQGIGKTTFGQIAFLIGEKLSVNIASVSIDDFYTTYEQRQILKKKDPRIHSRGPPGTHDVDAIRESFNQIIRKEKTISFPIFDKSLHHGEGNRIQNKSTISDLDILLFDGWMVGYEKQNFKKIKKFPKLLNNPEDMKFASYMNSELLNYMPLWKYFNHFLMMVPKKYEYSIEWRKEAERKMRKSGKAGKSEEQIEEFVKYFWKSLHPEIYIENLRKKKVPNTIVLYDKQRNITQVVQNKRKMKNN